MCRAGAVLQHFLKGRVFLHLYNIAQMLHSYLKNLGFTCLSNSVGLGFRN